MTNSADHTDSSNNNPDENSANPDQQNEFIDKFYVGEWLVDAGANRLENAGDDTKVESKVMEVLCYLAKRPGELVTREELEKDVWKGRIVSYESLTSTINKLRKAFDDDSRNPRFIETVSKKGYRLIAEVKFTETPLELIEDDLFTDSRNKTGNTNTLNIIAFAGFLLIAVIAMKYSFVAKESDDDIQGTEPSVSLINPVLEPPSIVVLPFADLSGDSTQRYLGEGITEDLTTALSKLSGLLVIARTSAMNFTDETIDIKQVAEQLNVRYILEGSVRRAGDQLRVNAKLIDGESGFNLWAEQYDRQVKDIFEVQDDITSKIVSALSVTLTEEEQKRTASQYTASFAAYEKFLQGQVHYMHFTHEDNLRARELYQHSTELDPNFARAFSAMALTYTAEFRYGWSSNPENSISLALSLVKKAIAINELLPQAHWVQGYSYLQHRQYDKAIASAQRAIELSPNYADGYATLGVSYIYAGNPEQGMQMMQRAMRLNPQYPAAYSSALGQAYYFMQRFEDAVPRLRTAMEKNPNLLTSHVFLIATLSRLNQQEDAKWAAEQLKTLKPDFKAEKVDEMFPISDQVKLIQIIADLKSAGL